MKFLKSLLFSFSMITSTVTIALVGTACFMLPFKIRYKIVRTYATYNIWALGFFCGIYYEIEGRENIPDSPVIILSKHQSTWETLALQLLFPPLCFVLKRQLLLIPFFGWGLATMKPIAINRAAGRDAVNQIIRLGLERLRSGICVTIFPEGTRIAVGKHGRYKMGGAILATETGYPIVPVAHNAGYFWAKRAFIKNPGTIKVHIGPMILAKDRKPEEVIKEVEQWVQAHIDEPNFS